VTVVGSGAEACSLSSLLVTRGALVTLVTEERAIMNDVVPHYLSNHITWIMRRMGVEVCHFSTFVDPAMHK
jgi:hypothetical protein